MDQQVAVGPHAVENGELLPSGTLLARVAQGHVAHRVKVRGHPSLVVVRHVPVGDEGVHHALLPLGRHRDHVLAGHDRADRPPVLVVGQVILQKGICE